jgi:S1-C subfamily serine protease
LGAGKTGGSDAAQLPRLVRALRSAVRRARPLLRAGLLAFLGAIAYRALYPPEPPLTPEQVKQIASGRLAAATPAPAYSAVVYQVILPSLVVIQTQGQAAAGPEQGTGVGTGVVINADGDILTALHVVA